MTQASDHELRVEIDRLRQRVADLESKLAAVSYSTELNDPAAALEAIIESSADCVFLKGLDGRYLVANSQAAKAVGKRRDEILGKTDREILGNALAEEFSRADQQVLASGQAQLVEEEIPSESGELRVFQALKAPCLDSHGRLVGLVGISRDITAQKRIELEVAQLRQDLERQVEEKTRELRTANRLLREDLLRHEEMKRQLVESEEECRAIVEGVPIPLAITRPSDGSILFANQRTGDLAGIPADQLVGQTTYDFYEDLADRDQLVRMLREDKSVTGHELRVRRPDGTPIWLSLSIQRIRFHGDDAVLCAIVDITDAKLAEASLRKEQRLLQRLLDTHQRERQLTAFEIHDGMAQDMTASLMFLETVRSALPPENQAAREKFDQALDMIRRAVDEARRVIEGLAPPVLEAEGILPALNSLIDDTTASSDLIVTLHCRFDGRRLAPAMEMSLFRIAQESLNNAWRHGQARLARIRLNERGETIRISIRDFGKGFDVSKVSRRRYGLRGIRERARLLGGRAKIVSKPGKGTLVTAELPVVELHRVDEAD